MKKSPLRYRPAARELESRLDSLEGAGTLAPALGQLVLATAAATQGRPPRVREVLGLVLARGADPAQLREAILQSYLFVGYPRVINALAVLRELCGDASASGPVDLRLADLDGRPASGKVTLITRQSVYDEKAQKNIWNELSRSTVSVPATGKASGARSV